MYLWEPLDALSASAIRQRLRVWRLTKAQAVQGIPDGLALHFFQHKRKEANGMSSIETLASTTSLSACAQPVAGVWIGQVGRTCKHQSKPSPAFGLTVAITNNAWRRDSDELPKGEAKNRRSRGIKSYAEAIEDPSDQDFLRRAYDELEETLKHEPTPVPQKTLPEGIEKYASGRKFSITKKGSFGLGPQKSEPEDRVAVLFGSGVPFVLRKCVSATGKRAWKIVGECYVHRIIQGEVIQKWNLGSTEAQMPLLL
ncbi:hypothetical protein HDV62DRAFT_389093 [Trichoderma sp. SZMC 28011]